MWLLDKNIPRHIEPVLKSNSIQFETVRARGWDELRNGELLRAASDAGFICILTRDVLFEESAKKALKAHPQMAIVLIKLPQAPGKEYSKTFSDLMQKSPIVPMAGQLVVWPAN
ncbi:MAG: DUF5615 family PIN-like protein [Deltaproteobacteria bacterium]|nr:DUF5615 family PIN-like protein [Deltaproteobacteria bacterium]MBI3293613.1 DUF5615 family PIN-like protein [Deltaproteobacteria bacterium]